MTLIPATADAEGCASVAVSLGTAPDYVTQNAVGLPEAWLRSWVSVYPPTPVVSFFLDTGPDSTNEIELVLERGVTAAPSTLVEPSVQP